MASIARQANSELGHGLWPSSRAGTHLSTFHHQRDPDAGCIDRVWSGSTCGTKPAREGPFDKRKRQEEGRTCAHPPNGDRWVGIRNPQARGRRPSSAKSVTLCWSSPGPEAQSVQVIDSSLRERARAVSQPSLRSPRGETHARAQRDLSVPHGATPERARRPLHRNHARPSESEESGFSAPLHRPREAKPAPNRSKDATTAPEHPKTSSTPRSTQKHTKLTRTPTGNGSKNGRPSSSVPKRSPTHGGTPR